MLGIPSLPQAQVTHQLSKRTNSTKQASCTLSSGHTSVASVPKEGPRPCRLDTHGSCTRLILILDNDQEGLTWTTGKLMVPEEQQCTHAAQQSAAGCRLGRTPAASAYCTGIPTGIPACGVDLLCSPCYARNKQRLLCCQDALGPKASTMCPQITIGTGEQPSTPGKLQNICIWSRSCCPEDFDRSWSSGLPLWLLCG